MRDPDELPPGLLHKRDELMWALATSGASDQAIDLFAELLDSCDWDVPRAVHALRRAMVQRGHDDDEAEFTETLARIGSSPRRRRRGFRH